MVPSPHDNVPRRTAIAVAAAPFQTAAGRFPGCAGRGSGGVRGLVSFPTCLIGRSFPRSSFRRCNGWKGGGAPGRCSDEWVGSCLALGRSAVGVRGPQRESAGNGLSVSTARWQGFDRELICEVVVSDAGVYWYPCAQCASFPG